MPAQILITKEQIAAMHELDEDVVVCEPPGDAKLLDVWVMDEESTWESHHRSVILDQDGKVLGDETVND